MTDRVVRSLFSLLLAAAGVVHLVRPEVFLPAMPPYVPGHLTILYATGVLELAAAVGLWTSGLRRLTAWCLAAYFVAVLPSHFHVAIHEIPMFGIRDPALLWGRLAGQSAFIYGAVWLARGAEA